MPCPHCDEHQTLELENLRWPERKPRDPAAADGSQIAAGILNDAVDASAADAEGVAVVRLAEVNAAELIWPAGITAGQKTTALGQLVALNIIAR